MIPELGQVALLLALAAIAGVLVVRYLPVR